MVVYKQYHTRQVARYGQKNLHSNSIARQTTERGILTVADDAVSAALCLNARCLSE